MDWQKGWVEVRTRITAGTAATHNQNCKSRYVARRFVRWIIKVVTSVQDRDRFVRLNAISDWIYCVGTLL